MRIAFAIFLLLHGVAHLVGFAVPWRLVSDASMPYTTTILNHAVDVGDGGIRGVGLLFLLGAFAFVITGIGVITTAAWWEPLAVGAVLFSLIISAISWPEARIGVYINLALLLALLLVRFGPALGGH